MFVTILYLDPAQQRTAITQEIADLARPTITAVVDNVEGQRGTVLSVQYEGRILYRPQMEEAAARLHNAMAYATRIPALPRCGHNLLLMDRARVPLQPRCGCRYPHDVRVRN